jgi:hypothetical protein
MWDLWWTKCHWGRFSLSTSVSPANSHSTDWSTFNHLSSGAGTIGQKVAAVSSGLSRTKRKIKKKVIRNRTIFRSVNIYVTGYIGPHCLKLHVQSFTHSIRNGFKISISTSCGILHSFHAVHENSTGKTVKQLKKLRLNLELFKVFFFPSKLQCKHYCT